ncbi:MAG: hypothetical protein EA396_01310 [Anaerolineaceae bacterium]|nr:MAG: hypothetical protein EA396_01310 [Anaerolineaceae bacterium]
MKPGFGRAVGAGILGFLGSIVFVIALRYLQGIEPVYDAGVAMVLAAFVSSFAFVWGIGGTDPRMSQHPHEPEVDAETGLILAEEAHDEDEIEEGEDPQLKPTTILNYSMWTIAFYTVLVTVSAFALANMPLGLLLKASGDPNAAAEEIGFFDAEIPILGEVVMSQLTVFVIMVIAILVIMGALGSGLALIFTSLSRNLTEVRAEAPTRLTYQTEAEAERRPYMRDLIFTLLIIGSYVALFDFMVRGSMNFNGTINAVLIVLSVGLGMALTVRRARGRETVDAIIEAVKVHSMVAGLIFLFPVMYILHYEALVGFIITTPGLRELLSLGGTVGAALTLTFVLYNDTVSDMLIRSARALRDRLRETPPADTETTAITPMDEQKPVEVES